MIPRDFVERFIDGYIFEDLEAMSHNVVPAGKKYGAVAYPMIGTIMSGMELLGGLLLPNTQPYNPREMSDNFKNYWDNYFAKEYPQYAGLGEIFYGLIRNGIAHVFIAKHGIVVNKFAGPAILVDQNKQELYLNPNELYRAFKNSYTNHAKPILDGLDITTGITDVILQGRIDDLSLSYQTESQRKFSSLPPLDPVVTTQDYWAQIGQPPQTTRTTTSTTNPGPSGPIGPVLNIPPAATTIATPQASGASQPSISPSAPIVS